jgi:hypothetical protein
MRCFSKPISVGAFSEYVEFSPRFASRPNVQLFITNDSVTNFSYLPFASGVSTSGFHVVYSSQIDSAGYRLNVNASVDFTGENYLVQNTYIPAPTPSTMQCSGVTPQLYVDRQWVAFGNNFPVTPHVFCSMSNPNGNDTFRLVFPQGITTSGFYAAFSTQLTIDGGEIIQYFALTPA